MRTIVWVALVGLFASALLAAQARAADAAPAAVAGVAPGAAEQCGANSQAGMRDCLQQQASSSAALLKQAQDQAAAAIGNWDEDAKYVKQAKAKLQASNLAFDKFAAAQCAFAASLGGGAIGNALELRRLACSADLQAQRAAQLHRDSAALPQK